jgi:hypothetical protein
MVFLGYSQIFGHPQLCWRLCFVSVFPFCLFQFMTFSFVVVPVLPYPPKYHNIQTCSLRANVRFFPVYIYIYRVLFLQYCRWWKQPCMETPKFGPDPWHSTRVQPAVKTKLSQLVGCSICLAEGIGFVSHTLSGDINYLYTCSSVLGWTRTQICQAILCLPTTSCNFKGFFSTGNLCIWAKAVVSTIDPT